MACMNNTKCLCVQSSQYNAVQTAPALPIAAKMASSRAGLTPREGRGGFTGRNLDKTMTKYLQALEAS